MLAPVHVPRRPRPAAARHFPHRVRACGAIALTLMLAGAAALAQPVQRIVVLDERGESATLAAGLGAHLARNGFGPAQLREDRAEIDSASPDAAAEVRKLLASGAPARLVVTANMGLAQLVRRVDARIPLVFRGAAGPVQMCLAESLTRPGRHATGQTSYLPIVVKMIETLRDAYPRLDRWVVLVDGTKDTEEADADDAHCDANGAPSELHAAPAGPCVPGVLVHPEAAAIDEVAETLAYAQRARLALVFHRVCSAADLAGLAAYAAAPHQAGVVVPFEYLFYLQRDALIAAMKRYRLPAVYARKTFAEGGGLMALAPLQIPEVRLYELVVQVLRGADPSALPIQTGAGFEVWINLGAARTMGAPPSLRALTRAEHLIEPGR
jgi:putative ABC transport system substrate-binding protein